MYECRMNVSVSVSVSMNVFWWKTQILLNSTFY